MCDVSSKSYDGCAEFHAGCAKTPNDMDAALLHSIKMRIGSTSKHDAGNALAVVIALAIFAAVHSLFASMPVKGLFTSKLGVKRGRAAHRVAFVAQSFAMLSAGVLWFLKLPDRELYRVRGAGAWLMRTVQALSFVELLWVFRSIGMARFLGVSQALALLDKRPLPQTPEAQGPGPDDKGKMDIRGPFKFSRHPYNIGVLGIVWFFPRMTVNLLAMAIATSAYTLLGSLHEEQRLRQYFGPAAYDRYVGQVSFTMPNRKPVEANELSEIIEAR
jgi:protein-S-isoprenylcysteine O-methyltransferase Ste14